jgi:hypothetical protein
MAVGSFIPLLPLAAGDLGVRSIQTITLSATMTSGTMHLVAYRVLGRLPIILGNTGNWLDVVTAGFPRLYDNTVPFLLWLPATTTAPVLNGHMIVTQG